MFRSITAVAIILIIAISEAADPDKDFVFPDLQELGLGDRCTVKGYQGGPQLVGVCRRVRDCGTFPQRVIQRQFNFFDDLCYFEVHDPVVCCLSPADASRGGSRIAQEDQWPEYEQINAVWLLSVRNGWEKRGMIDQ